MISTNFVVKQNIFLCCRGKLVFRKNQPYMHVVIALFCFCSTVLYCQHIPCAGPFRAATYYVADFSDEE